VCKRLEKIQNKFVKELFGNKNGTKSKEVYLQTNILRLRDLYQSVIILKTFLQNEDTERRNGKTKTV
jgi:hypothetical protein